MSKHNEFKRYVAGDLIKPEFGKVPKGFEPACHCWKWYGWNGGHAEGCTTCPLPGCIMVHHKESQHECHLCYGRGHDQTVCPVFKPQYRVCGICNKKGHYANDHVCENCGVKGHGAATHACKHCSGVHTTKGHHCPRCQENHSESDCPFPGFYQAT